MNGLTSVRYMPPACRPETQNELQKKQAEAQEHMAGELEGKGEVDTGGFLAGAGKGGGKSSKSSKGGSKGGSSGFAAVAGKLTKLDIFMNFAQVAHVYVRCIVQWNDAQSRSNSRSRRERRARHRLIVVRRRVRVVSTRRALMTVSGTS